MLNKITSNNIIYNPNISFGNSKKNDNDKINVGLEKKILQDRLDVEPKFFSALFGLAAGGITKLAKKSSFTALTIGFESFLAAYAISGALKRAEYIQNNKDAYKEYEKDQVYNNKFDEFISKRSVPVEIDFGDEEKNRQYYDLAKSMRKRELIAFLVTIGATAISAIAATAVCFAKKLPDKLDKIGCVSLITGVVSFFATEFATIPANKKDYDNQSSQKK